jgi:S1-C subfamily serine protease
MSNNTPTPISANSFHVGTICPFCQHLIDLEQPIVLCESCRSWHHNNCWELNKGCSSYHCDTRARADILKTTPEFSISVEEVAKVKFVPPLVRRISSDLAKDYLPEKPQTISKLAVISFILSLLNLVSIYALFFGETKQIIICLSVSFLIIILGVIAVVILNNGKKYGYFYATFAIFLSATLIVFDTARIYVASHEKIDINKESYANFKIEESLPKDEELDRLPQERANALRANVVIKSTGGTLFSSVLGSGVVINKTGKTIYLLTNKHVIENSKSMEVSFYNGEISEATIVWQAPKNIDIVIISCTLLAETKIKPVTLFSGLVGQAQTVFAIGNPMNLLWSYTEGVISSRRIQNYDGLEVSIYQTQTPINSGNSGGGLYNQEGKLIGINSWTQNKAFTEGLNFAISSKSILSILEAEKKMNFIANTTYESEK